MMNVPRTLLSLLLLLCTHAAWAQWQTITTDDCFLYETKHYPTAEYMIAQSRAGKAMPRRLKKGEAYRVLALAEQNRFWPVAVQIETRKKHRKGWLVTSKLQDRTALIPLVEAFRDTFRLHAEQQTLAPHMNATEVFVCSNVFYTPQQQRPCPWNAAYTMWGNEHNFLLFLRDSLCTAQMATRNLFYYKPHYKVELVGVKCNQPVTDQHLKESSYWDENFEINWALGDHTYNFALQNNSTATLHLQWDKMAVVGQKSERVIHHGTQLEQRFQAQTPSVVARGTTFTDALLPVPRLSYQEESGWLCPPLVDAKVFSPHDRASIDKVLGTEHRILFVVTRDEHTYEYTFTLRLTDVQFTLEQGSIDALYQLGVTAH